ncbi:hypothetical protein EON65_31995 [archaeon]|nr:MAG: hypothetical protein EON65_31995 [archaeon]
MNKTAFLEEIVQTKRRRLCNSELTALENVLDGVRINKKLFKRHQRLPSFDSYDLLAATLLSLRPRKHSIRHEHAQSHLHTLGNKLRHNNYEVLYNTPAGAWLEFGVASGQSINVTAFMLERRNLTSMVPVYGFDSFLGLPVEWAGHMKKGAFSSGGTVPPVHEHVTILQGWFNTTLDPFLEHMQHCRASSGHSVLGINIDNDLYDGALMILRKLARCLKVGSVLHFHELYSTWDANNPMEELLALYDFMIENTVTLRLMPVMSSAQEAGVLSVLQIA